MGAGTHMGSYTGGDKVPWIMTRPFSPRRTEAGFTRATIDGEDVENVGRRVLPRLLERPWVAGLMATALTALLLFATIGIVVSCIVLGGGVGAPEMCLAQSFLFFASILSLLYIIMHLVAARRNLPPPRTRALQHPLQSWAVVVARIAMVFWLVSVVAVPASFVKLDQADTARIRPGQVDLVVCAFGLISTMIIVHVIESSELPFTLPCISRAHNTKQPGRVTCRISALGVETGSKTSLHRVKNSRAGSLETREKCKRQPVDELTPVAMVGHEIRVDGRFAGSQPGAASGTTEQRGQLDSSSSIRRETSASASPAGPRAMPGATGAVPTTTRSQGMPQQPRPTYSPRPRGDGDGKNGEVKKEDRTGTPAPAATPMRGLRLSIPGGSWTDPRMAPGKGSIPRRAVPSQGAEHGRGKQIPGGWS